MSFSQTLNYLRKKHNVTQEELAHFLNVSRSTIAGYETRNREPEYEVLTKIATFFNVSIDFLITGSENHISTTIEHKDIDYLDNNISTTINSNIVREDTAIYQASSNYNTLHRQDLNAELIANAQNLSEKI